MSQQRDVPGCVGYGEIAREVDRVRHVLKASKQERIELAMRAITSKAVAKGRPLPSHVDIIRNSLEHSFDEVER